MKEDAKACDSCGGVEGEMADFADGHRHVRMQDCIKHLSQLFRKKPKK